MAKQSIAYPYRVLFPLIFVFGELSRFYFDENVGLLTFQRDLITLVGDEGGVPFVYKTVNR